MTQLALNLDLARRLGTAAILRAQVRAEHASPSFTQRAAGFIAAYLEQHGPLPGELLTDLAKAAGHVPPDDSAFGAVYKMLVREGRIQQAGWCDRRKGHGTGGGRIWAAVDNPGGSAAE
jgi:hypothetical protein